MPVTLKAARKELFKGLGESALTFADYSVGKGTAARTVTVASNADYGNRASLEISNAVVEATVGRGFSKKLPGQSLGDIFERQVAAFLRATFLSLPHLRPGKWAVNQITSRDESAVTAYEQYSHLGDLAAFCLEHRQLAAALGN